MKIAELRTIVKKHSKAELEFLVAELYKVIPKNKKEDYQLDKLIEKPFKEQKTKKVSKTRSIDEIASEVAFFHENAMEQNYLAPNSYISKKDRPKWRFVVKRLFKEIVECNKNGAPDVQCGKELQVLYETLTHACRLQIFSAYDPFESVGIDQADFYEQVVRFYREGLEIDAFLIKGINLITENSLNRYTLYNELMEIFIKHCETPAMKELAIEHLNKLREIKNKEKVKKNAWGNDDFYKNRMLNNYTEFIFRFNAHLHDFDKGIQHYMQYYIARNPELKLYILISILFEFKNKDSIFEVLKSEKTKNLRKGLIDLRNFIQKHNKLPEYML